MNNDKLLLAVKRRYTGCTQREIAALANMPEPDVSLIWTRKRELTLKTLAKLAAGANTACWQLVKEAEEQSK